MKHLFVVAAGGTGAKVIESLVHLCAAGIGPTTLDILLLDVDQANGNVERTRETAELYRKLGTWDWTISPLPASPGGQVPLAGTRFFQTNIRIHACLEPIETVQDGLDVHLRAESGAQKLLDLLYDEDEQSSRCEKGFLARPNLGSLVLGGHLREKLAGVDNGAATFKAALLDAVGGATPENPVPLAVVGSIFGGTGASLFPVVCQRLEEALKPTGGGGNPNWDKLAPAAVMLTPYFLPNQNTGLAEGEEPTVDPSRFLADTANTLEHYGTTRVLAPFKAIYLVGSDRPEGNRLRFVDGARDQANPPYIEEVIAALAILDVGRRLPDGGPRTRVYQPPGQSVGWSSLPLASTAQAQIGLFLEWTAFLLLPAKALQPLSGGLLHACDQWSAEFEWLPWYERLLGSWAREHFSHAYGQPARGSAWRTLEDQNRLGTAAASEARNALAEYAYRVLLWTRTALPDGAPYRLVKLGAELDYAGVWEVMCGLLPSEIAPVSSASGSKDNALVRLARAGAAALAKIATGQVPARGLVLQGGGLLPGFPGQAVDGDHACALPIDQNALQQLEANHRIRAGVHAKFNRTEVVRP